MLTPAQLLTLKAAILAETNAGLVALRDAGATGAMAEWLNTTHPTFIVWKDRLTLADVREAWTWTEIDSLTQPKQFQFTQMFASGAVDVGKAAIRQGLQDIFAGAALAISRAAIIAAAKRPATRAEAIFATGTGSFGSPGVLTFSGAVSDYDVIQATTQA